MRRSFQILIILFAIILFGAPTCNDKEQGSAGRELTVLNSSMDSLRESFGSEHLSATSLEAFEVSASQKLPEFADYLRILGDTSLNASFKDKAREMIRDLFLSEDVKFPVTKGPRVKEQHLTLKQILDDEVKQIVLSSVIIFDSIHIRHHFQRRDDTTYSGSLKFILHCKGSTVSGSESTCLEANCIDIYLVKRKKTFGGDTLNVWKVFLGDLK
jgi:hypothetical protein